MPKFKVVIERTVTVTHQMDVNAASEEDAATIALDVSATLDEEQFSGIDDRVEEDMAMVLHPARERLH